MQCEHGIDSAEVLGHRRTFCAACDRSDPISPDEAIALLYDVCGDRQHILSVMSATYGLRAFIEQARRAQGKQGVNGGEHG